LFTTASDQNQETYAGVAIGVLCALVLLLAAAVLAIVFHNKAGKFVGGSSSSAESCLVTGFTSNGVPIAGSNTGRTMVSSAGRVLLSAAGGGAKERPTTSGRFTSGVGRLVS
jgi:hypothetical protein